jgi:hypothetical protein
MADSELRGAARHRGGDAHRRLAGALISGAEPGDDQRPAVIEVGDRDVLGAVTGLAALLERRHHPRRRGLTGEQADRDRVGGARAGWLGNGGDVHRA